MKLATWNLALPVSPTRRHALRKWTDRIAADIWVLTESHDGFCPGLPFHHGSAPGRDGRHGPGHRWVSIWSRYPLQPLETSDAARTAAVRVRPEGAKPFLVFGTVLPWRRSEWRGHPSAGGEAFRRALEVQVADWTRLRREFPSHELFVLGDFNQDLVGSKHYGTKATRTALDAALTSGKLIALTAGGADPIHREASPCACIDHICTSTQSSWRQEPAVRWPDTAKPDKSLTDHFGVAVTFVPKGTVNRTEP